MSSQTRRNLVLYFVGYFISMAGTSATQLADGWLSYRVTHSESFLSFSTLLLQIPYVIFSLLAASLLARFDLKRTLLWTYLFFGFSSLLFGVYVEEVSLPLRGAILLFSLSQGACQAFEVPSRLSILPRVVSKEYLSKALAGSSLLWNISRFLGPLLGGMLIEWGGESWCFIFDGISYFVVAAMILYMDIPRGPIRASANLRPVAQLLRKNTDFVFGIASTFLCCILASLVLTFLPVVVSGLLQEQSDTLTMLRAALGLGGLVGAVALLRWGNPQRLKRALPALLLFAAATIIGWGLVLNQNSLQPGIRDLLSAILVGLFGWVMCVITGGANIVIQHGIAEEDRARASAYYGLSFYLPLSLAPLLLAPVISAIGIALTITYVGIGVALTCSIGLMKE